MLSDILFNSVYPEKELKREKEVVIEEINSYKDSPAELIFDDFEELVYDGHPIARNILGTPECIARFDRDSIIRFTANNYHTDQMVISSVGKINFEQLKKYIQRYFGFAETRTRLNGRKRFENYSPNKRILQKDTFQAHCILGNVALEIMHPKRIAMVLLNNIIGGQAMNSRLNLALRERKGMAYNIESGYTAYSDTGLFSVYFGTEYENLEKAINIVLKEFKLLREKNLGSLQLSKAQKQLMGQIAISSENYEDLMLAIGKSYLVFNKVDTIQTILKKIEKVTPSDLMEVANQVLDEKADEFVDLQVKFTEKKRFVMVSGKDIENYILEHIEPEDPVLQELDRETHLKMAGARMLSGHLQGQALTMIAKMINPLRILELGTFTGYSAICLAKGLQENGKLFTIEQNDELRDIARKYFIKSGLQHKITLLTGNAKEIIPSLSETFDLVYMDADKREYVDYFNLVFNKVRPGGFILADNTIWGGKVLEPTAISDRQTQGIIAFNESVKNDSRIEKVILPLRDGLTIIRKK